MLMFQSAYSGLDVENKLVRYVGRGKAGSTGRSCGNNSGAQ